jgi:hypothetical protein
MTVMLKDAPGGAQLIDSLTEAIKTLSLLYAGTPDDKASEHLQSYLDRIEPGIIGTIGPVSTAKMLDIFRRTVLSEKRRLESGGASRA